MDRYLEVEDRPVVVRTLENGIAECWVWNSDGWTYAPGLLGKTYTDGISLTEAEFCANFPEVKLPIPSIR